jgi:hypothetical protein
MKHNWEPKAKLIHTGKLNQARPGTLRHLRIGLVQKCRTVAEAIGVLILRGKRTVRGAKSSIRWMVRNGYLDPTAS